MANLRLLAVICLFVCANTAHADWQYTKWGTTREQVRASSADVIETGEPDNGPSNFDIPLHAPYSAAGLAFDVRFGFDCKSNRLSMVLVTPEDRANCPQIESQMASKYGTAVDASTDGRTIKVWRDQSSGNRIEFTQAYALPMCSIRYFPLAADANNGL